MILPGNIQRIFDEARCPICQSHLTDLGTMSVNLKYPYDEVEHEDEIGYLSDAHCANDIDHYWLSLEWSQSFNDPVERRENFYLYTSEYEYAISIKKTGDKTETSMMARPLDEEGNITEERACHSLDLFEDCFDLSNFNQECYIDKIETLMLFK